MASWFADCFEAAPYLWVVGPLASGKTKLLKLLSCLCRRGLIAGDLRSGSLYKLINTWAPTLLIDELEPGTSGADSELRRLLRTGSVPDVATFRDGQAFSTYGVKIISSRQPLADAALLSRGLVVSMLPSNDDLLPLNKVNMQKLAKIYQRKLLSFRFQNLMAVRGFDHSSEFLKCLSPRSRQIARALMMPLLGDPESTAKLLNIFAAQDEDARGDRSLEPEWLVAENLFDVCHQRNSI